MTEYISTMHGSTSYEHCFPGVFNGSIRSNLKRKTLDRYCARLADSGIEGQDSAIEYLNGKYIKNLSIHTIRMSGRIVLSHLGILSRAFVRSPLAESSLDGALLRSRGKRGA